MSETRGSLSHVAMTPQQLMGHESYSGPCRVGNWAEEEYRNVLSAQELLAKSATGKLKMSKLAATVGAATAPVPLEPMHADGAVQYGDIVMLTTALGGVLCANAHERLPLLQETFQVTRAEVSAPQQRTRWIVAAAGSSPPPADGLLRLGEPFQLIAASSPAAEPLFLQGQRYTLTNAAYSTSVRGGASKRVVTLSECAWARTRDDARPYSRDYEQPMTPSSVNRETGLPGSGWGRPSAQEIVKQQGYGACKSRRSDDVAAAHLSSPQRLTAPPPPPIQTRQCP